MAWSTTMASTSSSTRPSTMARSAWPTRSTAPRELRATPSLATATPDCAARDAAPAASSPSVRDSEREISIWPVDISAETSWNSSAGCCAEPSWIWSPCTSGSRTIFVPLRKVPKRLFTSAMK